MMLKSLWQTMTADIAEARAERALLRQMREELAPYRTESEIYDLLAAIDRSESSDADAVRSILEQRLNELHRPLSLAS